MLDKEQQESLIQRQAEISANFINAGNHDYRLVVFNRGKATATNVRIECPEGNELIIDSEIQQKFPMPSLESDQTVELIAAVHMMSPRKMDVRLIWNDPSGNDREKLVTVTL